MQQSTPPDEDKHGSTLRAPPDQAGDDAPPQGLSEDVVPLVEETPRIEKREAVKANIRIHTAVDTVEEFARADLKSEDVEITRVPIDKAVEVAPSVRTEDDVVIVPVLEEVLVVEKRLILKEELHIRRRTKTETVDIPVQLRRQRAVVERVNPDDEQMSEEEAGQ